MVRIKAFGYRPSEGPEEIERQYRVWATKPQVRSFYEIQVFRRIERELRGLDGPILEIGSGAGAFKSHLPSVIATDVVPMPVLDVRCSALELPFAAGSLGGIVAINVLHHLPSVGVFLREAERVLRPGGRFICAEPWITPGSRVFYRWFHQEECHPVEDPWFGTNTSDDRPMHGNTYVPYQVLGDRGRLREVAPRLDRTKVELFSGLGWCLSMGFREGALLPDPLLRGLLTIEDRTAPLWTGWGGLNALIVLTRGQASANNHPPA